MDGFFSNFFGSDGSLSHFLYTTFQITDLLDIIVVAFLIYEVMIWIRRTRGWILF